MSLGTPTSNSIVLISPIPIQVAVFISPEKVVLADLFVIHLENGATDVARAQPGHVCPTPDPVGPTYVVTIEPMGKGYRA